jgi:hypothetical protein
MKNLLYLGILIVLILPSSRITFAVDDKLPACIENLSEIKCFQGNFYRTYRIDYKLFWKHWRYHEANANACTSKKATADFLSVVTQCDGEVAEAMYEFLEKLIINNVSCFLSAAETLDDNTMNHLVKYYIMTPLYHEPSETLPLIEKELKKNKYPRFNTLYFKVKKTKN